MVYSPEDTGARGSSTSIILTVSFTYICWSGGISNSSNKEQSLNKPNQLPADIQQLWEEAVI